MQGQDFSKNKLQLKSHFTKRNYKRNFTYNVAVMRCPIENKWLRYHHQHDATKSQGDHQVNMNRHTVTAQASVDNRQRQAHVEQIV